MIIKSKLSDQQLLDAIYRAAAEYSQLVDNSYLIIGKNKHSPFFWFQCHFEKKHFMHLLGIKSNTLNANEFFDACDTFNKTSKNGITISDCSPSRNHNRTTINEKCSCCADILRLQDARYMRVGPKDKISQYVDFSFGYGNNALLGFKKINDSSIPVTLIPKSIDQFISEKYKIILILQKGSSQKKYNKIVFEAKIGRAHV